jgi:hypothetical protein
MTIDAKVVVDSYQLILLIFKISKNFPKHYRPTLGRRLEDGSINLTLFVRVASLASGNNRNSRRILFLEKSSECLDEIRILLQICHDLQIIPISSYGRVSEATSNVGRQIGSFFKSVPTGNTL